MRQIELANELTSAQAAQTLSRWADRYKEDVCADFGEITMTARLGQDPAVVLGNYHRAIAQKKLDSKLAPLLEERRKAAAFDKLEAYLWRTGSSLLVWDEGAEIINCQWPIGIYAAPTLLELVDKLEEA